MSISTLDAAAFLAIHLDEALSPVLETAAEALAVWGIYLVPLCLGWLWFSTSRSSRSTAVVAGLAATLALTLSGLVSWTFYIPRPFMEGLAKNVLHHVADSSFPSDHVAVFGAAFFASLLGRRFRVSLVLGLGLVSVAWARIALGIHYPSDVLGALVVGGLAALLFKVKPLARFVQFGRLVAEAIAGPARCARLARGLHIFKPERQSTWSVFTGSRRPH